MNNTQFRSLLSDGSSQPKDGKRPPAAFKTPLLGSRARSSIPMTPRSIPGYSARNEFARQVAEHTNESDGQPPTKKFRSSAAPKGTKLAHGYQDRAKIRDGEEDADNTQERRMQNLEEMYKLQQIDAATLEKLKSEIGIGGNAESTHLVKGLDWKLLDRVRRGEDINKPQDNETDESSKANVEDELDDVLQKDVLVSDSHFSTKSSQELEVASEQSQVMSRNEILRKLRESRVHGTSQLQVKAEAVLGERFKKVRRPERQRFVEVVDGRRREVLLTTDRDGNPKRKVRWLDDKPIDHATHPTPNANQPLGMEVPAEIAAKQKALMEKEAAGEGELDDDDIFQGVGIAYDPLADIGSESGDESGSETKSPIGRDLDTAGKNEQDRRNYFEPRERVETEESGHARSLAEDPTILAALKRAAALRQSEGSRQEHSAISLQNEDVESTSRHAKILERMKQRDQEDARDLDMGFGESRFGDEEDEEGPVWDGETGGKKSGRKRGPKRKKGDKDNVDDVMSVLQSRKPA